MLGYRGAEDLEIVQCLLGCRGETTLGCAVTRVLLSWQQLVGVLGMGAGTEFISSKNDAFQKHKKLIIKGKNDAF
jgi:hypothetical protein